MRDEMISLYIPCFNASKYIVSVLEAVFSQSLKPDDVIVVDDCSTDDTAQILQKYPVRVIRNERNKGLAACRNIAVKCAKHGLVAALDADCCPDKFWLQRLKERICVSGTAGAGGRVIENDVSDPCDLWRSVHMKQHWDGEDAGFLFGSNTLFRADAISNAGLYDESLGNNYEDVDICQRMNKHGYVFSYEPGAFVRHLKNDSLGTVLSAHWNWGRGYYEREGFYDSEERFFLKIEHNLRQGLEYVKHDLHDHGKGLVYLDLLLPLHHSIRDFNRFFYPGYDLLGVCFDRLVSLIDLNLCLRLYPEGPKLPSLMKSGGNVFRTFWSLGLMAAERFVPVTVPAEQFFDLYRDLSTALYGRDDQTAFEWFRNISGSRSEWGSLLEKKQEDLKSGFIRKIVFELDGFINELNRVIPGAMDLIRREQTVFKREVKNEL